MVCCFRREKSNEEKDLIKQKIKIYSKFENRLAQGIRIT